jgi:glycosyltransferase involved in cell wall biosynthesis
MLSVIIPSFNCPYSTKTVQDILRNSVGEIEVIVHVDGMGQEEVEDKRVTYLYADKPIGMRAGINAGLKIAKGKFIMKVDDHCLFAPGFDKVLTDSCAEDWLMVPRRYAFHGDWHRDERFGVKDYHYLPFPTYSKHYGYGLFPQEWKQRTQERMVGYDIDDTMSFQGSCWLANRRYFMTRVNYLDDTHYSTFSGEQLEVGLKYWLGGGKVKVNKNTWYAHLFKNDRYYKDRWEERSYKLSLKAKAGWTWASKHWINNEEPNMVHPFSWLVEKFWPVPSWTEDRSLWKI